MYTAVNLSIVLNMNFGEKNKTKNLSENIYKTFPSVPITQIFSKYS